MFVKELKMYLDYLKNELNTVSQTVNAAQVKKWHAFKNNLLEGIKYYEDLFSGNSFSKMENNKSQASIAILKHELIELKIPELELV